MRNTAANCRLQKLARACLKWSVGSKQTLFSNGKQFQRMFSICCSTFLKVVFNKIPPKPFFAVQSLHLSFPIYPSARHRICRYPQWLDEIIFIRNCRNMSVGGQWCRQLMLCEMIWAARIIVTMCSIVQNSPRSQLPSIITAVTTNRLEVTTTKANKSAKEIGHGKLKHLPLARLQDIFWLLMTLFDGHWYYFWNQLRRAVIESESFHLLRAPHYPNSNVSLHCVISQQADGLRIFYQVAIMSTIPLGCRELDHKISFDSLILATHFLCSRVDGRW